jgi:hypothetical protein
MPFIPRQVKPPARVPLTCKVPEEVATLLKQYAAFSDGTQEYVVTQILRRIFRQDREFKVWLATRHLETRVTAGTSQATPADQPADQPNQTDASADSHGRAVSSRR